ncbi:hypothetical protein JR316_0008913 [Psilocybe cubensis]|uniref:Uncharacterized protein n=1 Tax=Psilocybe cubensis TaxID=181762 RepID=A0ACB8GRU2_PSICU|nr:hypothetical protein JR316_0008913 [Psilocybe cubensis]KAH9478458.1 hypothetical protein JR316_0008913 [Psilocybe cubensis]
MSEALRYPKPNTTGGQYPMQEMHAPLEYSSPEHPGGTTTVPVDPAMATMLDDSTVIDFFLSVRLKIMSL